MKIALFGASGTIGSRIAKEAESRGHSVTRLGRSTDINDASAVAKAVGGHDAVVNATGPREGAAYDYVKVAHGLLEGLRKAGVKRVLVVGGAGSLEVAPGKRLVDSPDFPAAWKGIALSHADALGVYRKAADLEWTYVSPAAFIQPGERTGKFRIGGDQLLTDARGESRVSAEDFAIAVVDELEKKQNVRKRITVAY